MVSSWLGFRRGGMQHLAFMKPEHRDALVVEVAVETAHPILHRMRAWERMLAQERQQIDLALELVLALDLVHPQQEFALGRFEHVVAVDRTLGDTGRAGNAAEAVVVGEFLEERFA